MYFKYLCNGEEISVFDWNWKFRGLTINEDGKDYDIPILTDEDGDYFVWKDTKIYQNDFIKLNLEDLKKKMKEDKDYWLTSEDLVTMILTEGIKNIAFVDNGYTEESNGKLCKINESKYQLKSNYKITVVFNDFTNDFYTNDLASLVRKGIFDIVRI